MKVAFRAEANGLLVCADDAMGSKKVPSRPLQANRDNETPTSWETFDLLMQTPAGDWVPFEFPTAPTPILPPEPVPGDLPPDWIDIQHVQVNGSDPACLDFPANATWNHCGFLADGLNINITTVSAWPPVVIDETGNPAQNATLWMFLCIGGAWYATGAERLRPEQILGSIKPEGPLDTLVGEGWLYDASRWGVMAGYNPAPGEIVGAAIVAGSTRTDNQTPVKERTPIVFFPWPTNAGADPVDIQWTI